MGAPCKPSYTSHFTVVTKKKLEENICESPSDFESLEGLENYFPGISCFLFIYIYISSLVLLVLFLLLFLFLLLLVLKGEAMKGDEIALFDSSHVLPRFIVHYTVEKNRETFQSAEQRYSLPRPITGLFFSLLSLLHYSPSSYSVLFFLSSSFEIDIEI